MQAKEPYEEVRSAGVLTAVALGVNDQVHGRMQRECPLDERRDVLARNSDVRYESELVRRRIAVVGVRISQQPVAMRAGELALLPVHYGGSKGGLLPLECLANHAFDGDRRQSTNRVLANCFCRIHRI